MKRDVQTSFLWTKEGVVQMFEGKEIICQLGLCLTE